MTTPDTVTSIFRLYVAGEALNSSQTLANLQALDLPELGTQAPEST